MADSVSLHITDEERVTTDTLLEDAQDLFPDVEISVEGSEINLTGDVYDHINKCKTWFELKLGRIKTCKRRSAAADIYNEEDPSATLRRHEHSNYVSYEKISVVVVKADLLDFDGEIDCFVNTTNSKLEHHSQVSKLFREAGGEPYETACERVRLEASKLRTTQCMATEAGNMKTKYVIHALSPSQADYGIKPNKKEVGSDIFSTVFNCLEMAEKLDFQSIAFSFLSTGHGQLDIQVCSQQYAYAVLEFSRLRNNSFLVDAIYFIDKNQTKVDSVNKVFRQILPENELQLLEVPKQDYSNYYMTHDQQSGDGTTENLEQNFQKDANYTEVSDADDGQTTLGRRSQASGNDENIEGEYANTELEVEHNDVAILKVPQPRDRKHGNEPSITIYNRVPDTENADADRTQLERVYERVNTREIMPEFRRQVGKHDLVIEKCDIRTPRTKAIVCPEIDGVERGGLFAASIKCTFRQSFDPRKLSKLQRNAIATTEYTTEKGDTMYILHVSIPSWKAGTNEKDFMNRLKEAMEMIFSKLKRHKRRKILSIAIPLLGIDSVENVEIVGKCCKWQIEKVVEILQRREEIANLQEVYLINRCETITNTLIIELKIILSTGLLSSTC